MKLSKRETFMVIALLFFVVIAGFWFIILSPAQDTLSAVQSEYDTLKATDDANQAIINSVVSLNENRDALKSSIVQIENKLLPELDTEVITEHLAKIFENNGMKFITETSCDPIVTEQLLLSDNTYSNDSVQWVRVNMKISGTDGVTEGGIPAVGYNEFIKSIKEIEAVSPDTIHLYSVSIEDSTQGFQYFNVSVDVFAFTLPDRIEAYDPTAPYITWDRDAAATGGTLGIPYASVPVSQIQPSFYKPFATTQITDGTTVPTVAQAGPTQVPTP